MTRSTIVTDNLNARHTGITHELGALAYARHDFALQIERIDKDVAQLEGQKAIIEVTLKDVQQQSEINDAAEQKEKADAKEARSQRSKAAAKKRKRT